MPTRIVARQGRLKAALDGLEQARARSTEIPATLLERQKRDHRIRRRDSTSPQPVLSTVAALSAGQGTVGAAAAAASGGGGSYYDGGGKGGGGGFGGGGQQN